MKPLASSLGFLGEIVVDEVARDLFVDPAVKAHDARS
jgi:hypothetical protein